MKEPLCYVIKSSHAHYWYCVERGVWVVRADVTRFTSRSAAFEIAKMLRRDLGENACHRIYVAAVHKRTRRETLRRGIEKIIKVCRPCTSTREDGCTGCHIVEELELLLKRTAQPSSASRKDGT